MLDDTTADTPTESHTKSLASRARDGALMAAALMLFNLAFLGTENPVPLAWKIIGVLLVTVGGAVGGVVYYSTESLRLRGGWHKSFANILSLLAYSAAVVLALVLAAMLAS